MKRILAIAIAAMLVVAFAIPTFAAPKIELVGGAVKTHVTFGSGNWGTPEGPVFGSLKFKLSADNFVFNVTTAYNVPTIYGNTWNTPTLDINNYDFSLDMKYIAVTGNYNDFNAQYGIHLGREFRIATTDAFKELAGFTVAAFNNDDGAGYGSTHVELGIPVGEAFTGTLKYGHEATVDLGTVDLFYTIAEGTDVDVYVAKNITSATNDFLGAVTVNLPLVENWKTTLFAEYGMTGFAPDTDTLNWYGFFSGYDADVFEVVADTRYNNEATTGQALLGYYGNSTFSALGTVRGIFEYVSNGGNSYDSSNARRANYADTDDGLGRSWNSQYKWVRDNNANEYAARLDANYNLGTNAYGATAWAMFAPDAVPVVLTAKGNYKSTGDWYFHNWVGVRITPDVHLAVWDRYIVTGGTGVFDVDTALVYNRDSVTFSVTGTNLVTAWGADMFLGISF